MYHSNHSTRGSHPHSPIGETQIFFSDSHPFACAKGGASGQKWCRLVLRPEKEAPRPEFDSPLLQKDWFDSNSVAEGCGSNAHRGYSMKWLVLYIVVVLLFLFWNYCAHKYDED